jgi:hypothetical protein
VGGEEGAEVGDGLLIAHAAPGTSAHDGLGLLASPAVEPATSPGDQGSVVETFIMGIS